MSTTGDRPPLTESERDAITDARTISTRERAGADGWGSRPHHPIARRKGMTEMSRASRAGRC